MIGSIHIVIHIAISTLTGIGGVALLRAGGGCHHSLVVMLVDNLNFLSSFCGKCLQRHQADQQHQRPADQDLPQHLRHVEGIDTNK